MQKVIIFAGSTISWVPGILEAYLEAIDKRQDLICVGVCITPDTPSKRLHVLKNLFILGTKLVFNSGLRKEFQLPEFATAWSVAKKYDTVIIEMQGKNINDPGFIRTLKDKYRPSMALSLGCLTIWSKDLLNTFDLAVNYHNGYLPNYKGLWATNWSVYQGEVASGYAFHVMDERIDTGPVIVRGLVPILENESPALVERRKVAAARKDVDNVMAAISSGKIEPITQSEKGSYYSETASRRMWNIENTEDLTLDEFNRRMRCFSPLHININGTYYPVTSLKHTKNSRRALSFKTSDGIELHPDRIKYVPVPVYNATRKINALFKKQ